MLSLAVRWMMIKENERRVREEAERESSEKEEDEEEDLEERSEREDLTDGENRRFRYSL